MAFNTIELNSSTTNSRPAYQVELRHPLTLASFGIVQNILPGSTISERLDEADEIQVRVPANEPAVVAARAALGRRNMDTMHILVRRVTASGTVLETMGFKGADISFISTSGGMTECVIGGESLWMALAYAGTLRDSTPGGTFLKFWRNDISITSAFNLALSFNNTTVPFAVRTVPATVIKLLEVDNDTPLSLMRKVAQQFNLRLRFELVSGIYQIDAVPVDTPPVWDGAVISFEGNLGGLKEIVRGGTRGTRFVSRGSEGNDMADSFWLLEPPPAGAPSSISIRRRSGAVETVSLTGDNIAWLKSRNGAHAPLRQTTTPNPTTEILDAHWFSGLKLGNTRLGGDGPTVDWGTAVQVGGDIYTVVGLSGEPLLEETSGPKVESGCDQNLMAFYDGSTRAAYVDHGRARDAVGSITRSVQTEIKPFENVLRKSTDGQWVTRLDADEIGGAPWQDVIYKSGDWVLQGYDPTWIDPVGETGVPTRPPEDSGDAAWAHTTDAPLVRYGANSLEVQLSSYGEDGNPENPLVRDALVRRFYWNPQDNREVMQALAEVHALAGQAKMFVRTPSRWVLGEDGKQRPVFDALSQVYPREGQAIADPPTEFSGLAEITKAWKLGVAEAKVPPGPVEIVIVPENQAANFVIDAVVAGAVKDKSEVSDIITDAGPTALFERAAQAVWEEYLPDIEYEVDASIMYELAPDLFGSQRIRPGRLVCIWHPTILDDQFSYAPKGTTAPEVDFYNAGRPLMVQVTSYERSLDAHGDAGRITLAPARTPSTFSPVNNAGALTVPYVETAAPLAETVTDKPATIRALLIDDEYVAFEVVRPNGTKVTDAVPPELYPTGVLNSTKAATGIYYRQAGGAYPVTGWYAEGFVGTPRGDSVVITLPAHPGFYAKTVATFNTPVGKNGSNASIEPVAHAWTLHPTIPGLIQFSTIFKVRKPDGTYLDSAGGASFPRAYLISTGLEMPVAKIDTELYSVSDGVPLGEGYFPFPQGDTLLLVAPASSDGGYSQSTLVLGIPFRGFLDDMRDVAITGPLVHGQTIAYDSTLGVFRNTLLSLPLLNDVDLGVSPAVGSTLILNGDGIWRPGNPMVNAGWFKNTTNTINWAVAGTQGWELPASGSETLEFENAVIGARLQFVVEVPAASTATVVWPTEIKWSSNIPPVLAPPATGTSLYMIGFTPITEDLILGTVIAVSANASI